MQKLKLWPQVGWIELCNLMLYFYIYQYGTKSEALNIIVLNEVLYKRTCFVI